MEHRGSQWSCTVEGVEDPNPMIYVLWRKIILKPMLEIISSLIYTCIEWFIVTRKL
jgi:hypothetical protein